MYSTISEIFDVQNKQKMFKLFFILACCFIFIRSINLFVNAFYCSGVGSYAAAHHLINYEFGLIPRALFGATIGELTQIIHPSLYLILYFIICMIPYVVYCLLYWRIRKRSYNVGMLDAVALFALTLPTTFLPLTDFLRLDIVLLNCFLLCALVVWKRHWTCCLVPFGMIIMTLIHEAAIFMFLPALCGIAFFRAEKKIDYILTAWLGLGILSCCILYLFFLKVPASANYEAVDAFLQKRNTLSDYITGQNPVSLTAHFQSAKDGYVAYALSEGFTFNVCMQILCSIPFTAVAVGIVLYVWRAVYNSNPARLFRIKSVFLFISTLSNICLFIGYDYNRWIWAWLTVNILLFFLLAEDLYVKILPPVKTKYKRFFIITLFIFLVSGTGNCHAFSKFSFSCGTLAGISLSKFCAFLSK